MKRFVYAQMSFKSLLCADNPVSPLMETSLWDCDIWLPEISPYWGIITNTGDVVNTTYNSGLLLVITCHVIQYWPLIGPPSTLHPWRSDVCLYLQNVGSIFLGWIKMCCLLVWWGHIICFLPRVDIILLDQSEASIEVMWHVVTNQRPVSSYQFLEGVNFQHHLFRPFINLLKHK